jgi:hypothetical protein
VPDFEFLCNAALTADRLGPLPIQRRFWSCRRAQVRACVFTDDEKMCRKAIFCAIFCWEL